MTYKNIKLPVIAASAIFLAALSSCTKYLDKKYDATVTTPTTIADLQSLLDEDVTMSSGTPANGESSGDDFFLFDATFNSLQQRNREDYTWIPREYRFQNDWSIGYNPIYVANLCLDLIETIPKTQQNELPWNNVKGSAYFFRAYYFYHLAGVYIKAFDEAMADSDPGLVLRTTPDFTIPSVRSTVRQTYEQVINDTKASLEFLPDHGLILLRPSRAAAFGLLAKAYLSTMRYDSAAKYSSLCLQLHSDLMDYNDPSQVDPSSSMPFKSFNKETIFYSLMNGSNYLHSNFISKIDSVLVASYQPNDLRSIAFFEPGPGHQVFKGTYTNEYYRLFTGIATDEIYLTRAECFARLGDKALALQDLNTLLEKRWVTGQFVPIEAADAAEALSIILVERRKELLMRGIRWSDLKRLNKEGHNIVLTRFINGQTYTLAPNANHYAYPLPIDIIEQTGIAQNEF